MEVRLSDTHWQSAKMPGYATSNYFCWQVVLAAVLKAIIEREVGQLWLVVVCCILCIIEELSVDIAAATALHHLHALASQQPSICRGPDEAH